MVSSLPLPETPLYNHTLPDIEQWLRERGCEQDAAQPHLWHVTYPAWSGQICLEIEELSILYHAPGDGSPDMRRYKYSLSRQDIENAVFAGP